MISEIKRELGRRGVRWDVAERIVGLLETKNPMVRRVFKMRMNGKTYQQIEDETGYPLQSVQRYIVHQCRDVRLLLMEEIDIWEKASAQAVYRNRRGEAG